MAAKETSDSIKRREHWGWPGSVAVSYEGRVGDLKSSQARRAAPHEAAGIFSGRPNPAGQGLPRTKRQQAL